MPLLWIDADERPRLAERAVVANLGPADRPFERVDEVEQLPVRRNRRPVGDGNALKRRSGQPAFMETIEGAAFGLFIIVHGAEPDATYGVDHAVVKAVRGQIAVDLDDELEAAVRFVKSVESRLQPGDEPAAARGKDETDRLGRVPASFR